MAVRLREALLFALLLVTSPACAQTFTAVPFNFVFGTPANASQVMADFQSVVNNGNAVANYINSKIAAVTPPPSNTLLYFNLTSCPSGWVLVNLATNFIRGLDLGRGMDTTGTGLVGGEAAVMQDHTHGTSAAGISLQTVLGSISGASSQPFANPASQSFITNPSTSSAGGSEVRPKNISLIMCQKT